MYFSYDLNKKRWKLFLDYYGYKNSKIANKILDLFFMDHYVGMINWKFERLHFISTGKADLRQYSSNRDKMVTEIEEDLLKIKKILDK